MNKMGDVASAEKSGTILDEVAALARLRAGDQDALARCVRTHISRLLQVARRILSNEEDARDAVQDAFLSAFKQLGRFEGRSRLETWLHRIVVNAALARLRIRFRHPERSIEDLLPHFTDGEHQLAPPIRWKRPLETALEQQETRALVRDSISQLPESNRTVLHLRDIERLDTEETARMVGTSLGVVKTRLHRARQALRSLLDPYFREDHA